MEKIELVKDQLKQIISEDLDLNIDKNEIRTDISLYEDGVGLDSISIVNFIVSIEEKFSINFNENEMNTQLFSSIDNLAELIATKI